MLFRETGAAESEIRVGFLTYAKEIHFYNVKVSILPSSIHISVENWMSLFSKVH